MADIDPYAETPMVFTGKASRFWGLALGNLLLTIITFGIYRFWAKTRVRRYLWANTSYLNDPLEYRGRGIELFVGALIVFAVLLVPLVVFQFVFAALAAADLAWLGVVLTLVLYVGLIWLVGLALYRSLRYRLSRTSWRGIRGGMTGDGKHYGVIYLKMLLLQVVTLGFASPYITTRLWNALWSDAMVGSAHVTADADWRPLFKTFLWSWIASIGIYAALLVWLFATQSETLAMLKPGATPSDPAAFARAIGGLYLAFIGAGIVIGFIMLRYYAQVHRTLFGATRLATLQFRFDATTGQWFRYYLGNLALVVGTLGLGLLILPYRLWGFYVRHLSTVGSLDVAALEQTSLAAPSQGEGLADAFDVAPF